MHNYNFYLFHLTWGDHSVLNIVLPQYLGWVVQTVLPWLEEIKLKMIRILEVTHHALHNYI